MPGGAPPCSQLPQVAFHLRINFAVSPLSMEEIAWKKIAFRCIFFMLEDVYKTIRSLPCLKPEDVASAFASAVRAVARLPVNVSFICFRTPTISPDLWLPSAEVYELINSIMNTSIFMYFLGFRNFKNFPQFCGKICK